MKIKVEFTYEPDDDEVDADHPTGLTNEAHEELMNRLMGVGADDVEVTKA